MATARTNPEILDQDIQDQEPQTALTRMVLPVRAIPKAEVPDAGKELSDSLREYTDSMTAYVMLKQAELIVKSALEQTLDHAILKMSGKEMDVFGAKVSLRSLKEYQYDDSGLEKWAKELEELKTKISERQKFMKLIKTPQADTDSGEIVQPAKLIRDGSTLAVKFS